MFIYLFSSSFGEDVPSQVQCFGVQHAHGHSILLELMFFWLTSKPSTLIMLNYPNVDCFSTMLITKHVSNKLCNLDYDKITIQNVSFSPMTFNKDILFEMSIFSPSNPSSSQMQNVDKKYDGRAWSKVIKTNIKNSFGFSFKKDHCLGHLHYVQLDCDCFIHFSARNEISWVQKLAHLLTKEQVVFVLHL